MLNTLKYIDIHGHINFPDYDVDREEVFERAKEAGVGMIIIGTDLESSRSAVELAEKHENVWATVGVHPTDSLTTTTDSTPAENIFNHEAFKTLALHPKVVAIGECGLDYFHTKSHSGATLDIGLQRSLFLKHISLANEVKKPLMLHVRNGRPGTFTISAYEEAVTILKQHAKVKSNFHFFAGNKQDAANILEIGGTMSFTGVITFVHDYDAVIKHIPFDRIMTETDCPFVSPVPYRGKRNEPTYVVEVVKAITRIRGDGDMATSKQLLENAVNFFGL